MGLKSKYFQIQTFKKSTTNVNESIKDIGIV